MENPSVANLRSRSRSKTPLPPQSEVENGPESNERPNSKAGRKTPNKISRDTPTKLIPIDVEVINEDEEPPTFTSPPAHRTRNATRQKQPPEPASLNSEPTIVSEYSFEEADILSHPGNSFMTKETAQNIRNYSYEYERRTSRLVNTSSSGGGGGGLALWSSSAGGGSRSASRLQGSPSGSDRSNESFAESVLADSSRVSVEGTDHLPYRLYKSAIEYWNKYPKTDYTYSRLSKDRVELAPGQVAVPNMSRPSLGRVARSAAGDMVQEAYQSSTDLGLHRRWNNVDRYENLADSDYDSDGHGRLSSHPAPSSTQHWWITSLLISIVTTITSITSSLRDRILPRDPSRRYPYYSTNTAAYKTNTYTKETTWMSSAGKVVKKRKWWILIPLLLLLPLLYWYLYGVPVPIAYYSSRNVTIIERPVKFELTDDLLQKIVLHVKQNLPVDPPKPQIIERIVETNNFDMSILDHQQSLIDKLYGEIDTLKDQLAKNQDLDEKISFLSSKQSREMLIQAFGLEKKDGTPVSNDDIKAWLKKETFTKEDVVSRLAAVQNSAALDVNKIGDIVKEELKNIQASVVVPSVERTVNVEGKCNCDEDIGKIVREAIAIYDADKTGLVDYAMESAGGQVISTRCSESYQTGSAVYSLFGIPLWYPSNSPRVALTPGSTPGDCWAFQGFPGYLVIQLYSRIHVTGFTMEHTPRELTPHKQIESAPKKFTVWGLQDEMDREPVQFGTYEYRNDSTSLQYFPLTERPPASSHHPPGHQFIELRIESNHGNPLYTCLYRFRVHGDPVGDFEYYGTNPDR